MPRKRGRWSTDDQRRVAPEPVLNPPEPPPELEPVEAAIWRTITSKLPGDWFAPETVPMLKELCRHIRHADDLAGDLAATRAVLAGIQADDGQTMTIAERMAAISQGSKVMERLLRAHGYQSERIGNLATKLRMTNQSKVVVGSAAKKARDNRPPEGKLPWEDWGEQTRQ